MAWTILVVFIYIFSLYFIILAHCLEVLIISCFLFLSPNTVLSYNSCNSHAHPCHQQILFHMISFLSGYQIDEKHSTSTAWGKTFSTPLSRWHLEGMLFIASRMLKTLQVFSFKILRLTSQKDQMTPAQKTQKVSKTNWY